MSKNSIYKLQTLSYMGIFVDPCRLGTGIYPSEVPTLYPVKTSISDIVGNVEGLRQLGVNDGYCDKYIANLKLCELVPVEVSM